MGWWLGDTEGNSLVLDGPLVWGDEPADALSGALDRIDEAFQRTYGRLPTIPELQAGLLFSARVRYEDEGEAADAKFIRKFGNEDN